MKKWAIFLLLIVTVGAWAKPAAAFLCVEPIHPALEFTPENVDFGAVPIGGTKTVNVSVTYHSQRTYEGGTCICRCGNAASSSVNLSLPAGTPFTLDASSFTLAEEQSRTVVFTYHPTGAEAVHTSDVTASYSAYSQTYEVGLTGVGFIGQSNINPSATSVDFGNAEVGAPKTKRIILYNEGTAQLLGTISATAHFAPSISTFSVAPGQGVNVDIALTPTALGPVSGMLTVSSNDPDSSPLPISLTGNGIQQYLGVSTSSLNFGTIPAGESLTKIVKITNLACGSCGDPFVLTLSGIHTNVTPPFTVTAPVTSLAPGESTNLSVTYAPTSSGSKTGKLSFTTNDPLNASKDISLSGGAAASNLDPSALNLNFGDVHLGTMQTRSFTIRNKGASTLSISNIASPSSRLVVVPSSATIAAGVTQGFEARYTPTTVSSMTLPNETLSGSLTVVSNDSGVPAMAVDVSGRGVTPVMSISPVDGALSGSQIDLGTLYVGDTGSFRLQVSNTGNETLNVTGASSNLPSLAAQGLPVSVPPLSSATIYARYQPAAEGTQTANWSVASNDFFTPAMAIAFKGTAVSELDLSVAKIEVTQGIQDGAGDLPLVAGKKTEVRAFIASAIRGTANTGNTIRRVDGLLHLRKNGTEVLGSPLMSQKGPIAVVPAPDRKIADQTLNFTIPESMLNTTESDDWTLEVEINPASGARVARLKESAYDNNTASETVAFFKNYKPVIHYFPMTFVDQDNVPLYPLPNEARMAEGANFLKKIFPVAGVDYVRRNPIALRDGWDSQKWFQALFFAAHLGNLPAFDRVYGWLPEELSGGRAEDIPGRVAYGGGLASPINGQETFAHEMGHTYGLCHTHYTEQYGSGSDRCFVDVDGNDYSDGHAVEFSAITEVGFDVDSQQAVPPISWAGYGACCANVTCANGLRYTDCMGGVASGCHVSQCVDVTCENGTFFTDCSGHDVPANCTGKIAKACSTSGAIDVMAYKQNANQSRWIHPQRYQFLFQKLRTRASDPSNSRGCGSLTSCTSKESRPSLLVAGQIAGDGSVTLDPVFAANAIPDVPEEASASSSYALRLVDAAGKTILTYPLNKDPAAAVEEADEPGESASVFSLVAPQSDGVAAVQVLKNGDVVSERRASAHPPTVSLSKPEAGESVGDLLHVSWMGSDDDGDPLTYSVLYSADGGATFRTIGVDVTDTEISYEAARLPGGNAAVVRVIASDGFLTASADSAGFSVGRKPPSIKILSPVEGETAVAGAPLSLSADADDLEDGPLPPSSVQWSSDAAGPLGSGNPFSASLTPGLHHLTAKATDADGQEASAVVTLLIVDGEHAPRADAGRDQGVDENSSGTLDASTSSDPDEGDVLSYSWMQTAGPSVVLTDATSANPGFTAPKVGADTLLRFALTVTDAEGHIATDSVDVTVKNTSFPALILSTKEIDFGTLKKGQSTSASFTIRNGGQETLNIENIEASREDFSADPTTTTLEPGQAADIIVTFSPQSESVFESNLYLRSNAAAGMRSRVVLKGRTDGALATKNDNGIGASLLPQTSEENADAGTFSPDASAALSAGGCSLIGGGF
ncbi:MAG TPA: choice-of-anchor D domain-containing protein [bacterium]|nr:choice-of-anchor D domain-containing protein [bacterium]